MATGATPSNSSRAKPGTRLRVLGGEWLTAAAPVLLALLGGFGIGGVIILVAGESPLRAYAALLRGGLTDPYNLAATITRALPIIGTGIGAAVAMKAGLWNIGLVAQMLLGALGAVVVALYLPVSEALRLPLALAASMLAGGLCALLIGWFQTQFDVPILLGSLLTNYLAINFVSYTLAFPLCEVTPAGISQTKMIPEACRLGRLVPRTNLHSGVFIIIGIVLLATFFLRRTVSGYEVRMFGANRQFAIVCGVDSVRLTLMTMLFSGMIAGVAGAIQVLGVHYRLIDGCLTGPGYAWIGVMAAILSNNNPLGVVAAGLFFSAIQTGAMGMERATKVPSQLSFILQAVMILLVGSRELLSYVQSRRKYEA